MPCENEFFGRVFVPGAGKSSEFQPLSTGTFSNLDFKWYDFSGNLHPKFSEYENKHISLGFKISNENRHGKTEEFQGKFQLPLKLGEIKSPDADYLEELQQVENEFAKKFNIISGAGENDPRAKIMDVSKTGSMFVMMTPGTELVRQSNLFPYLSLIVTFDDILDNRSPEVSGFAHGLPYKQLKSLSRPTLDIYREGKKPYNNKMDIASALGTSGISLGVMFELNSMYNSFHRLNQSIYEEALKNGTRSDAEPFFQSLLDSVEAHTLQFSKELNDSVNTTPLKGARVELSAMTISTIMVGEAIAFLRRVKLSSEIRSSFLFKWLLQEAANYTAKLNDVFSYNKEAKTEGDCNHNQVYILHVENGLPLQKALDKVVNDANQILSGLMEAASMLLKIHDNDADLKEYIQIVKEVICGYLQWAAYSSPRYHPNLTFDCYVESEE